MPETVRDNVPAGSAVVVPQQAWRVLVLGFGLERVQQLLEQAKAERTGVGDGASG